MKRFLFPMLIVFFVFFLSSCNLFKYEAYVIIANIGSLDIYASVNDNEELIRAYNSQQWTVVLESEDEIVEVDLYAEPVNGNDYEAETVILNGDRDIETWLVGWDPASVQGQVQKKESRILKNGEAIPSRPGAGK